MGTSTTGVSTIGASTAGAVSIMLAVAGTIGSAGTASTSIISCSHTGGKVVLAGAFALTERLMQGSFLELDMPTSLRRKDSIQFSL